MKIWAHRGCSQRYPENTLLAFEKAADINGLAGIELDIQLTKDGEMVVIHDERVDRTTEGTGFVRDYTFSELRRLHIYADENPAQNIPTIEEVFDLLETPLKSGLKLNIELKNSVFPYEGMEEKIIALVHQRGLQDNIVYSSFYVQSMVRVKEIDTAAEIGILDSKVSDCLYKAKGVSAVIPEAVSKKQPISMQQNVALHPFWRAMDLSAEQLSGSTVRAWFTGHLYPEKPTGKKLDFVALEKQGITDVFLNEPEMYL